MRKRDYIVFALICIFLFVTLQQEGSISFEKSFYFEQLRNMAVEDHLPKPVITDIDSDGYNELLVASDQGHLKLIRLQLLASSSSVIHPKFFTLLPAEKTFDVDAHVKAYSMNHLGHEFREHVDHDTVHIVGLSAGHIDTPEVVFRKQIVVVVLSDWKVVCLDHNLNLLWETELVPAGSDVGVPSEVVVSVIPYRVQMNDRGMVVIGFRNSALEKAYHAGAFADLRDEQEISEKFKHYSYFAFNAENGENRWKHDSSDFQFHHEGDKLYPQHNHKLDAYQHLEHTGEVPWATYKSDLLKHLPHIFQHPHDTAFAPAHFNSTVGRKNTASGPSEADYGKIGKIMSEAFTLTKKKQTAAERAPNVLVVHLSKGIEVIHLYTGRTLCQLAPLNKNEAYADLNGDGVIDVVEQVSCMGTIKSGVPSFVEPMFKSSICKVKTGLSVFDIGLLETTTNELLQEEDEEQADSATPTVIHHFHNKKDAVFYVASGLLTTVTADPEQHYKIKWQTSTPSIFNKKHEKDDEWYHYEVKSYSLRNGEPTSYILALGESFLTILDIHGSTQQVIQLPGSAIGPLIVDQDVNGDGLNDIILTTKQGLYAFRARTRAGLSVISVLVVSLFILVSVMYLSTVINLKDPEYVKKAKDM